MKRTNKKDQNLKHIINDNSNNYELPTLSLNYIKSSGDFISESVSLSSSGWNFIECEKGLNILIDTLKKLKLKNE